MINSNRFTLWIILASATFTIMAGSIIAPVLNLMRESLEVDLARAALIITVHALFIALFSPLIGIIIDRVGVKKPFMFGLLLYGLAGGSGFFITSYWPLIVSRAFLGIAVAAVFTSVTVLILNLYEGGERNKIMGWRGSANSFGGAIWPLIGGLLGTFSWHFPFAVYLLGIPLGFLVLATVPGVHTRIKHDEDKEGSVFKVFRNNPILFALYGLMFLTMLFIYAIVVYLPPLLKPIGVTNPFYIGLFFSTMGISSGLTSFRYGRIKSRLSYKVILIIAMALWTVGFTTIWQAFSSLTIGISIVLFGIGQGMVLPTVMVWLGDTVPISFRGRITSYLGTFGLIGQFASPIIFAPLALLLGPNSVFLVAGVICAVLALLFFTIMKK